MRVSGRSRARTWDLPSRLVLSGLFPPRAALEGKEQLRPAPARGPCLPTSGLIPRCLQCGGRPRGLGPVLGRREAEADLGGGALGAPRGGGAGLLRGQGGGPGWKGWGRCAGGGGAGGTGWREWGGRGGPREKVGGPPLEGPVEGGALKGPVQPHLSPAQVSRPELRSSHGPDSVTRGWPVSGARCRGAGNRGADRPSTAGAPTETVQDLTSAPVVGPCCGLGAREGGAVGQRG